MKRNDVLKKYGAKAVFELAECVVNDGRLRTIANALFDLFEFSEDSGFECWDANYCISYMPRLFSEIYDGFADEWRAVCDHRKPPEE